MADRRIHNPDKSYSADVSRVSRSHDQDGHHTHIWYKPQILCPVTVLVDSHVSDHCPWATCFFFVFFMRHLRICEAETVITILLRYLTCICLSMNMSLPKLVFILLV